ncbi:unnamed protein product, partial [Didymodactylos carnosus]
MGKNSKRKIQLKELVIKKRTSSSYSEKETDSSSEEEDLMFQQPGGIDFTSKDMLDKMNEIMAFLKQGSSTKCLSVLLYMALRHFNVTYRDVDAFLSEIGCCRADACHKQADRFLHYGFERFVIETRGGKRGDAFWDVFPEIEEEARNFAIEACTRKAASFTVEELAQFIDLRHSEITGFQKSDAGFIRSVQNRI